MSMAKVQGAPFVTLLLPEGGEIHFDAEGVAEVPDEVVETLSSEYEVIGDKPKTSSKRK